MWSLKKNSLFDYIRDQKNVFFKSHRNANVTDKKAGSMQGQHLATNFKEVDKFREI